MKTPLEKLAKAQLKYELALMKLRSVMDRENEADIKMKSETKEK